MNHSQEDIERCAFVKGYNIIRARRKGRDLASIAMDEISQALKEGGLCDKAFHNRKLRLCEPYAHRTGKDRTDIYQMGSIRSLGAGLRL